MSFAFIDSTTGHLVVSSLPPAGVSAWWDVDDGTDPNRLYIDASGEIAQAAEPRPWPWFEWSDATGGWADARTPAELEEHRDALRDTASMPRHAFCVACARARILSEDEALAAATGAIPPAFQAVFDAMPAAERFENRARWLGAQTISRTDPIILACADYLGLNEIQVDALFGINP